MARRGAAIFIVAVCSMLLTASSAFAGNIPLPTPAPLPKTGAVTDTDTVTGSVSRPPAAIPDAAPQVPTGTLAPQASSPSGTPSPGTDTAAADGSHDSKGFFPFSLPFGIGAQTATAFTTKQRALLDRISLYLSSVQTMVGNFVQIGPDGGRTEGTFYIQKPGKVRFEYKPPTPIDIIADGSSVVVRDRNLATQDLYPLSQTPLRYLLADRIDLLHDTDVVSVSADDTYATVVIQEKQLVIGTNRLMIMFNAKDLQLKQWTVTDPQGLDTTVAVYNLDSTKKPDPNLFVINYQRNQGISNQ
jgi:outer membrane lipoprotein-sorting protein